jgi:hypothetical protein
MTANGPNMRNARLSEGAALPNIPKDALRFRRPSGVNEGGPYTPTIATLPHGRNRDFQNGTR